MEEKIIESIVKILLQFVVIIVAGGYVSKYYSKLQKEKEVKQKIIHEFSELFGRFISLRFKVNVHLYKGDDKRPRYSLADESKIKEIILESYNESCELLGRYQALKPLIQINFDIDDKELSELHQKYHSWRLSLRLSKPVYQSEKKVNDDEYSVLRKKYFQILSRMKEKS